MAHGSKRWIKTYSGRLKKSRNRTKIDWLSDLHAYDRKAVGRWKWTLTVKDTNCPQCRYVRKQVDDSSKVSYHTKMEELRNRFMAEFNTHYYDIAQVRDRRAPDGVRYVRYYEWVKAQPDYPNPYWTNNWRNYFCFKCERKEQVSNNRYRKGYPGTKENVQHIVKANYNYYRNEVRQLMRDAKYNEDLYDDIPVYKHDWLD